MTKGIYNESSYEKAVLDLPAGEGWTATGFVVTVLTTLLATTSAFAAERSTIDYSTYAVGPEPSSVVLSIREDIYSRGFSWQTDETVDEGEVRILKGDFEASDAARFEMDGRLLPGRVFRGVDVGVNRHFAEVSALEPGATYSYRLGGGGRWAYGRFTTRPKGRREVVVVNINDAQVRDARQFFRFANTCEAAAKTAGGEIDFVLHGGDFYDGRLFNAGANTVPKMGRFYLQWGMAADTATPFFPGTPWIMVSGNHDADVYRHAVNEPFAVEAKKLVGCHSFDCGNVHVATMPWLGRSWGAAYENAFKWLETDLESARKSGATEWSVVAIHAGPYTTGDNMRARKGAVESGFTSNLVFRMGGVCARQHVDLVLQAHDHCYSKTLPYRWDGAGFATNENDAASVNLAPRVETIGGKTYDANPRGTYYVCCGCAGHRVGEVREFADRAGRMSYTNRTLKVVTGKVAVDSRHAKKGADASFDLKAQMFGVLRVAGSRLSYDFYVAEPDGSTTLLDSLGIVKEGKVEHAESDGVGQALDTGKAQPGRARAVDPEKNGWILKPLGSPGNLKVNTTMPNKPVFRRRRTAKDGLLLFGGGKDAVLISQHGPILQRPMNELRYHLEAMVGRAVRVQPDVPEDGTPAIVIRMCDGAPERSVVRVQGNLVCIEGSDEPGISHALTYFLESLGCRYLWPGKSGKVIPRKDRVAVPDGLALDFVPPLRIRRIRNYYAVSERRVGASDRFGLDALKVAYARRQAGIDRPENRTFWQWHGLNDSSAVPGDEPTDAGKYRWEHRFNDYYVRYGAAHPEWFALQPDGTREMDSRPTFCMSREGLVKQIADDTVDLYRKDMSVVAHTLCLPDGGYKTWCQCPDCRRLDPVNAPEISCLLILPQGRERRPYVSYTDRLLDFYNRIVGHIRETLPDKRFTMYAYASYEKPPVKVVPDPSLIVISVAGGDYRSAKDRKSAERTLAAWGTFGNELIWRPNVLYNYNVLAPVNYSRWLYEDLELFKANNVIGTDFDCMNGVWPTDGLNFYMLAKAHLNPDRLSYDDVLDDYCNAAFGKGAPAMKRYFLELESQYAQIGEEWDRVEAKADPRVPMPRYARADCYMRNLRIDSLERHFDEAVSEVGGDREALDRILFMRLAIDHARMEMRTAEAVWSNSPDLKREQAVFIRYVHDVFAKNPLCISPNRTGFYDPYIFAAGGRGTAVSALPSAASESRTNEGRALRDDTWARYVPEFNSHDEELYTNAVPNSAAEKFLRENAPSFTCPDKDIERTYHFRWWTYRKHIKKSSAGGWLVTEFLPPVPWAGPENTINCAMGHHVREGRWLKDSAVAWEYLKFMLEKGRVNGPRAYACWPAVSLMAWLDVTGDTRLALALKPLLERNFAAWEKGWKVGRHHVGRNGCGLFEITDNFEGAEMSLGGDGYRPLVNSAMYGEALALARLCRMAGEDGRAAEYARKAAELEAKIKKSLWNVARDFFTTMRTDSAQSPVRELHGYAPWYFGMPLDGYEKAWSPLLREDGFFAPVGLAFPERSANGFTIAYEGHECQWNGPSWPYSTSVALTALARHLQGDGAKGLPEDAFAKLLSQYARQHRRAREDGVTVPWIDENVNPFTGDWISRTIILNTPQMRDRFAKERGKDYNHSTFCDLVISGLVGFIPHADGTFDVKPLAPREWEWFSLRNLHHCGHVVDIHYSNANGLSIVVDGICRGDGR